jgi:hypothetical protein
VVVREDGIEDDDVYIGGDVYTGGELNFRLASPSRILAFDFVLLFSPFWPHSALPIPKRNSN